MQLVIILLLSFLLRLIGINQSMWLDETISANVAKMPLLSVVNNFSINDFHPPVYYWFLNIWQRIFGSEVWIMRLSSVLFSLVTIWLVYLIGKEIKNKKLGIWAAVLLSVNPLFIYFSQELRMYMMAVMLLTGSIYFLVKMKKDFSTKLKMTKNILRFNILTALSFGVFYGSIFLIAAEILFLFFNKKIKLAFLSSIGIIFMIGIISPLLLTQLKNSGEMLNQVTNWNLVLGKVNLKNLLLIPLKFSIGKVSWWPKTYYYLIGFVWTIIVFGLAGKNINKNKVLSSLLILPIFLGIIFSFKSPLLQYFRFLYLIPILVLLLVMNKFRAKVFLLIGFLAFSLIYLINPKMHREDWKELSKNLDKKVYMITSFADPIKFYNPNIEIKDIKLIDQNESEFEIIPYGEEIHGINHKEILEKLNYKKISEKNFREITLEKWKK